MVPVWNYWLFFMQRTGGNYAFIISLLKNYYICTNIPIRKNKLPKAIYLKKTSKVTIDKTTTG